MILCILLDKVEECVEAKHAPITCERVLPLRAKHA